MMVNRPARIILDTPDGVERDWCWRNDWVTGWDSIYALLSKFAKLNAITVKEVASLFISSTCGRKTAIVRAPDVDLRTIGPFDVGKLSLALRVPAEQIRKAFVGESFPRSQRKAVPYLKWCGKCMREGFHSAIHQLEFLSACPVHGDRLLSECPKCHKTIPYRLIPEVFRKPYACPYCSFDLAPVIREPQTRSLEFPVAVRARLDDVHALLAYEDEVLTLAFELDRQRWRDGRGRFLIQGADLRREHRDYAGFASQVIDVLRAEGHGQMPLALQKIEVIRRTSWMPDISRRAKKKARQPSAFRFAPQDPKVVVLYRLYSAIRRRLWRHAVNGHHGCCMSVSRALWWDVEGEQTVTFCPVAEAFIRWRMYWEGVSIPQCLYGGQARPPGGIAKWCEVSAPLLKYGWSPTGEIWLTEHVFALALIGSFFDMAEAAFSHHSQALMVWTQREHSGRHGRYWAITGNDTKPRPLILFQEICSIEQWIHRCAREPADAAHRAWHEAQIRLIVR